MRNWVLKNNVVCHARGQPLKRMAKMVKKKPLKRMAKVRPSEDAKLVSSETIQNFLDQYSLIEVLIRCSRQDIITDDCILFYELLGLVSDSRYKTRPSKALFARILATKQQLAFEEEEF